MIDFIALPCIPSILLPTPVCKVQKSSYLSTILAYNVFVLGLALLATTLGSLLDRLRTTLEPLTLSNTLICNELEIHL